MKIVEKHSNGYEKMICESVGYFYGSLIVRLLNKHSVAKNKKVVYRLTEMDYEMENGTWN